MNSAPQNPTFRLTFASSTSRSSASVSAFERARTDAARADDRGAHMVVADHDPCPVPASRGH